MFHYAQMSLKTSIFENCLNGVPHLNDQSEWVFQNELLFAKIEPVKIVESAKLSPNAGI